MNTARPPRRWVRRLGVAAVVLVLLIGAGFYAISRLLDPATLAPRIEAAVTNATGRRLIIAGPLHVGLLPEPSITVADVTFANAPGMGPQPMARLGKMVVRLSWGALLERRVQITDLVLDHPDILLETTKDGAANWVFAPVPPAVAALPPAGAANPPAATAPATPAKPPAGSAPVSLAISRLAIKDGRITLRDARTGHSFTLDLPKLTLVGATEQAPVKTSGQIAINGVPVKINLVTGSLAALRDGTAPWPVNLNLQAAGASLDAKGNITAPAQMGGVDLAVKAAIPNLAVLDQLAAGVTLPPLHDLSASFALTADPRAGKAMLGALQLVMPQGTVSGALTLAFAGKPAISGQLSTARFDLDSLAAALAPAPPPPANTAAPPPLAPLMPLPARRSWLIPDTALPFAALTSADADLELRAGQIIWHGQPLRDAATHLVLRAGKLSLSPLSVTLPGGTLAGRLGIDAARHPAAIALRLDGTNLALDKLLALAGAPPAASGPLDIHMDVTGDGQSLHAIAASLSGSVRAWVVNGRVAPGLLEAPLAPLIPGLAALKPASGTDDLRCFAAGAQLRHGVARIAPLAVATSVLQVGGTGSASLGAETLDMHLRAQAGLGKNFLAVPVRVQGPWLAARVEWDGPMPTGLASGKPQFSALIGALTPGQMTQICDPALANLRTGAPMPAVAAPAKPGVVPELKTIQKNLGNMLQNLFH